MKPAQVRQVHQMAAARSLVEEEFLGSLAGLPAPQLRERLVAKFSALQEQAAALATLDVPEEEVRGSPSSSCVLLHYIDHVSLGLRSNAFIPN